MSPPFVLPLLKHFYYLKKIFITSLAYAFMYLQLSPFPLQKAQSSWLFLKFSSFSSCSLNLFEIDVWEIKHLLIMLHVLSWITNFKVFHVLYRKILFWNVSYRLLPGFQWTLHSQRLMKCLGKENMQFVNKSNRQQRFSANLMFFWYIFKYVYNIHIHLSTQEVHCCKQVKRKIHYWRVSF